MGIYQALHPRQMRVVILQRGNKGDEINCTLSTKLVDDSSPEYEALSYVWGDATKCAEIRVDRSPFTATVNLVEALEHLRLQHKGRHLWVDAICINQNDSIEKAQQIMLMGKIYGNTSRLVIWLGPASKAGLTSVSADEDGRSNLGMDLADKVGGHLEKAGAWKFEDIDTSLIFGDHEIELDMTPFVAFIELCVRPWFSRGWIVQEVLLPLRDETLKDGRTSLREADKIVICGRKTVSWNRFVRLKMAMQSHDWTTKQRQEFFKSDIAGKVQNGGRAAFLARSALDVVPSASSIAAYGRRYTPILELVYAYRNQIMSDPRDKIYGFLGIATDLGENDIIPNYQVTEATVYINFARFLLTRNQPRDQPLTSAIGVLPHPSISAPGRDTFQTSGAG